MRETAAPGRARRQLARRQLARRLAAKRQRPTAGASVAKALARLRRLKQRFARYIGRAYGHLAADCAVCPTPCCADAQFVNVNIVRLEAEAMLAALRQSPRQGPEKAREVIARARRAVARHGLTEAGDTFEKTYACPLFERGVGCLVHWKAKPAACIQHGCYERWEDLPETGTQRKVERQVAALDEATHGAPSVWLPIPLWLAKLAADEACQPSPDDGAAPRQARQAEPR